MEHTPIRESHIQRVCRIAKVLDISIEQASITCDAFHMAFSDDAMRKAIFDGIDELDRSAAKRGEPSDLIINYTVDLGMEGIRVARYADEIPAGEIVELTPAHRAMIHLRIVDDFPTQEFLGPLMVNRPEPPSLAQEGWQTDAFCRTDGVVCSDREMKKPAILLGPSSLEPARSPIPLGPIRLKFNERFPIVSRRRLKARHTRGSRTHRALAVSSLSLGGSPVTSNLLPFTCNLSPGASHLEQFGSGLSPPHYSESPGHSDRKMSSRTGNRRGDTCLTPRSLKISSSGLKTKRSKARNYARKLGDREVIHHWH